MDMLWVVGGYCLKEWVDLCCDCFDFTHLYNVLYGYALNFIFVYVSGHGST